MFRNAFFICILLILASMASHYAMAADSCQPVFDALTKVVTTPSHSYTTHTAAAAHGGTEKIYVDGKIYIRASGKWMQSPVTIAEVLEQEKEKEKQGKSTCNFVHNEFAWAEPAMVYSMHRETDGSRKTTRYGFQSSREDPCAANRTWTWGEMWAKTIARRGLSTATSVRPCERGYGETVLHVTEQEAESWLCFVGNVLSSTFRWTRTRRRNRCA